MSTFEFDDVIRQAKAIVRPEETVNEMKRLEQDNAQLHAQLEAAQKRVESARKLLKRLQERETCEESRGDSSYWLDAIAALLDKETI